MGDESWKEPIKRITDETTEKINKLVEEYSSKIFAEINRLKEELEKNGAAVLPSESAIDKYVLSCCFKDKKKAESELSKKRDTKC